MSVMSEFKEFAMKGNVVDMAVGVVIGTAFGKIVSSLVGDVVMPLLGKVVGGVNFTSLAFDLGAGPGAFHEDCTLAIAGRLVEFLAPRWLRIAGYWYPRGGMPIDVFWQTGRPPAGLWIPDTGVVPYRGRG